MDWEIIRGSRFTLSTEEGHSEMKFFYKSDTICGVSFLVLVPEHSLIKSITKRKLLRVTQYIEQVSSRSEK